MSMFVADRTDLANVASHTGLLIESLIGQLCATLKHLLLQLFISEGSRSTCTCTPNGMCFKYAGYLHQP